MNKIINLKSFLLFFFTLMLTTLIIGCEGNSSNEGSNFIGNPELTISFESAHLKKGDLTSLAITAFKADGSPDGYYAMSSDPQIADLSVSIKHLLTDGNLEITAKNVGNAKIVIRSESGLVAQCEISVGEPSLIVEDVGYDMMYIDEGTAYVCEGYSGIIFADAKNDEGGLEIYEISSDNESIVQVEYLTTYWESNGMLGITFHGINAGDANVTVSYNDIIKVIPVTVFPYRPQISGYTSQFAVYKLDNTPIIPNAPVVGGKVFRYSVSPQLPEGLSFNEETGVITGTPTVETDETIYTVIAENDTPDIATLPLCFATVTEIPNFFEV